MKENEKYFVFGLTTKQYWIYVLLLCFLVSVLIILSALGLDSFERGEALGRVLALIIIASIGFYFGGRNKK